MKPFTPAQLLKSLAIGLAVWLVVAIACSTVGSTGTIGWPGLDVPNWDLGDTMRFRFGSVLLTSLIGAALAASGCVYQAILRNPLADPYLLGVSSGASLAAYVWRLSSFAGVLTFAGAMSQQAFAFCGALAAVAIVFALSTRRGRIEPITLLLVGVIVSAVCGSVYLLVNEFHRGLAGSGSEMSFLIGGLQTSLLPQQKFAAGAVIGVGWLILLFLAGRLNVAALSDEEAASLGVRIHALRWVSMIVASLMTASAVAISGPIGFVGLVAPHMARLIVGVDQRKLLPLATAFGAVLLCVADTVGRFLARGSIAGQWLPVGVLTGLMGGPFFLLLLWQTRRKI